MEQSSSSSAEPSIPDSTVATPSCDDDSHYVVEEEYTVGVPLVRPKQNFLQILRQAGATGEVFTRKEIIQYLKDYISARQLYDTNNPRVVYCLNDPLGDVFQVEQFTIDDVLALLSQTCTQLPDMCLKRKRHLVRKPIPHRSTSIQSPPSSTVTIAVGRSPPVITSTNSHRRSPKPSLSYQRKSTKHHSRLSSLSSASSSSAAVVEGRSPASLHEVSEVAKITQIQKGESLQIGCYGSNGLPEAAVSTAAERSATLDKAKNNARRKRKRRKKDKSTSESSSGSSTRNRGTSSYPWYFHVEVKEEDQASEVLSVQDKETVIVQDSTDDLWFLEEDSVIGEESITMEFDSDAGFSLEYDVNSDSVHFSESDLSSVKSGEGVLVVCKDSDVEFFADSESDSEDNELSEGDKWSCRECHSVNAPFQRYCNRCWKLRSDWLPDMLKQTRNQGRAAPKTDLALTTDSSGIKNFSDIEKSANLDSFDSGIGSTQPSTQDSIVSCPNNLSSQESEKIPSLYEDSKDLEVRYTFSNFQKSSKNPRAEHSTETKSLVTAKSSEGENTDYKVTGQGFHSTDPCMICLTRLKTASIIHGSSGHQVCCFSCARRLKRRGKPCPVCRRSIQKVVKNYIL